MASSTFTRFNPGQFREAMLEYFRAGLRKTVNPATGQPWSESEIAVATSPNSRWYARAGAVDLVGQLLQARGDFLAAQILPETASSEWLRDYHAVQCELPFLPAVGAGGIVTGTATGGTVWAGSTTLGDPGAVYGTAENGRTFQVLLTQAVVGLPTTTFNVPLVVQAVDGGAETNLETGSVITWANAPLGAGPTATVNAPGLTGGAPIETDQDYIRRLTSVIRGKPGAGNVAQMRLWGRTVPGAQLDDAFVYASAYHAGSVHVCVLAKRYTAEGPLVRVPSAAALIQAITYLVPPGSPVVPRNAYVVVTGPVTTYADVRLRLDLPTASRVGFLDGNPWPRFTAPYPTITLVSTPTIFRFTTGTPLPALSTPPKLMVWDRARSRFESLAVSSVILVGGTTYQVTLVTAPSTTLAVGQAISPDIGRRDTIARTIEAYFDELGPGEIVGSGDDRFHRAARYPDPREERPFRAGASIVNRLGDALGSLYQDGILESLSVSEPAIPTNPAAGPGLLVPGHVGVYPIQ